MKSQPKTSIECAFLNGERLSGRLKPAELNLNTTRASRAVEKSPGRLLVSNGLLLLLLSAATALLGGCGSSVVVNSNSGVFLVTPSTAAFGSVAVGQSSSMTVSLVNKTISAVEISAASVTGSAFEITSKTSFPVSVASGGTYTFTVQFAPTAAGTATGQISVSTTAANTNATVVGLSGTGMTASTSTAQLNVNASSIAFGNVVVGDSASQSLTLTSAGTTAVTVSSATLTGPGFLISSSSFPATLTPGQTATVTVQFSPTAAGAASGSLAIVSTSATNPTNTVALSGTGVSEAVALTWDAPTSTTDPVASYHMYRALSGSSTYTLLGSTSAGTTAYTDSAIAAGTTYLYYVTAVDSAGAESAPSNSATVAVP